MVPITNQNAALPAITAPRAAQGRANTTAIDNGTAMRVAAVHRVLSTLSVEQQAEIMNVYRDVAGWTAEKALMAGVITTFEENALVDAATLRSYEADLEQLTARMTSLEEREQSSLDAGKIRSLEADVEQLTAHMERLNTAITTSKEKASVDAAAIHSLEADVEELTADKERLTVGITKLKKKAALDAANFRLLVRALINNDSKLFMQLPLEFRQYVRRQTKVGRAIIHSVVGLVFVFVGVMGIIVATDEYYASIYRKEDTIFRIVFGFTMMLFSSSKDLLSLLSIVALGFGFSLMIVGSMKANILVLTRSSSPPVPPTKTASVSNAIVPKINDAASTLASPNGIGPKNATSDAASTKAKARKLTEIRDELEVLVPAVIPEEADSIDEGSQEQELDYFIEKGDWTGVAAAAVKLSRG